MNSKNLFACLVSLCYTPIKFKFSQPGVTMSTETVTIELSESLYRTANRIAEATGQPLEAVLQASIAHALPPLDDVSPEEASDLATLALLDDATLWRAARATMNAKEQAELQTLLDRQGAGQLTPHEDSRLHKLLDIYGRITLRKAHAYLLLARRGYRVPMQENY
jgi:predicted transcriptional regulator